MVLQRKRRLLLGLGLAMTIGFVALPATASAVPTLTGESLSGGSSLGEGNSPGCGLSFFTARGPATGPYPGTFTEGGTFSPNRSRDPDFSATFTITSGTTTITGNKSGDTASFVGCHTVSFASIPYTATIHTPNGNFHDQGSSEGEVVIGAGDATLTETFTSSLAEPVLIVPTTKSQCKKGGWRNYPQFKNQGRCVRFVVTGKLHTSSPGSKAQGGGKRSKAPK